MIHARSLGAIAFVLACVSAPLAPPAAQTHTGRETVGPSRCVRCHAAETSWWLEIDGPPPRGHVNALQQLDTPDARRYAARLGIRDVYDTAGTCVACHATVFRGEAREGVSCESCHGPAAGYLEVHARPGAYRLAVAAGLEDLAGNVPGWARRCMACHLVTDAPLIRAGHSSGRDFDLGGKFPVVARHWKRTYPAGEVSAAGREAAAALSAQPDGR